MFDNMTIYDDTASFSSEFAQETLFKFSKKGMIIIIDSKTTTFNICIQAYLCTIPELKLHNIKRMKMISDASIVSEVFKGELKIVYVFAK